MFDGAFGCCVCCSSGGCRGFSDILGVSAGLFDMYLSLSVRVCGCMEHKFGQSWVHLG
jgi:hypothetical protein